MEQFFQPLSNADYNELLFLASGSFEAVQLLLKRGANPNAIDAQGDSFTTLIILDYTEGGEYWKEGIAKTTRLLLQHGGIVTPLMQQTMERDWKDDDRNYALMFTSFAMEQDYQ